MHKVSVITFLLVLCSHFGMAQVISEEDLIGKWLVKSVDIADDNPKHLRAVSFMKKGYTGSIFYFRGNGIFIMTFPKSKDSRIKKFDVSGENWRITGDQIQIGTKDKGFNTMIIIPQKENKKVYFNLSMMRLEVEKIKSEKEKRYKPGKSTHSITIENQFDSQKPIERLYVDLSQEEVVAFEAVDEPPVANGCIVNLTREEVKKCTAGKVMRHVQRKFNIELASDSGLSGKTKIIVDFVIDVHGKIINLEATGDYQILNEDAMNSVASLPNFKPGKMNGKPVYVAYRLPMVFQIVN